MSTEERIRKGYAEHEAKYHVATLAVGPLGAPVHYLKWGKPGTSCGRVIYMTMGNSLIVRGDYGEAIYMVCDAQPLSFWAKTNLHYFKEKCVASPGGRGHQWNDWSEEECVQQIEEFVQGHYHDDDEKPDAVLMQGCKDAASSSESFAQWLDQHAEEFMTDWWLDYSPHSWGNVPPFYLVAQHIGLKMAWAVAQAQA